MTQEEVNHLYFYGRISLLRDALFLAYSKELSSADLTRLSGSLTVALLNAHTEATEQAARMQQFVIKTFADKTAEDWITLLNDSVVAQPHPGNAPLDPNEPIITIDDRAAIADRLVKAISEEAKR